MKKFLSKATKSFHTGEKGFTLIELLIVIVILGVLAAAIIPNLSRFVGSGTVGAANAELASVRTAVAAFMAESATGLVLPTVGGAAGANIVPADIAPFINGATIVGVYTCDATGIVTGVTYTGCTWDAATKKWKK
jgi:type IV pilus assembly protein PilA